MNRLPLKGLISGVFRCGRYSETVACLSGSILWLDCIGGLVVGTLVLIAHQFLSRIEGLPASVVLSLGAANIIYGVYSLYVTTRKRRPVEIIKILALANVFWLIICLGIVFFWYHTITLLGIAMVVGEGFYVALLGITEWRLRYRLAEQSGSDGR